jgi:hypothetical protein
MERKGKMATVVTALSRWGLLWWSAAAERGRLIVSGAAAGQGGETEGAKGAGDGAGGTGDTPMEGDGEGEVKEEGEKDADEPEEMDKMD